MYIIYCMHALSELQADDVQTITTVSDFPMIRTLVIFKLRHIVIFHVIY